MSWEIDELTKEIQSVLEMWDLMAKRSDFCVEEGPKKWTLNDCKRHYGTWKDENGEEQICQSAAEQTLAKVLTVTAKVVEEFERDARSDHFRIQQLERSIKRLREFASMNDREMSEYMMEHIKSLRKDEGEEDLIHCPDWYEFVAKRLNPVSYTHLTLPTICSV